MYVRNPSLKFDLQVITKLLQKIGNSQIPSHFSQDLINFLQTKETAVYGINIGTNTRNNELYSDSIAGTKQKYENIAVVYDSKTNLPVSYTSYNYPLPGMPSPQKVRATLKSFTLNTKKSLLVQNRNGHTPINLYELVSSNIPYLLPMPADAPDIEKIEMQNQTTLMHHNNSRIYNNNLIFAAPFSSTIHDKPVKGYLYCDPQKGSIEQRRRLEDVLHICKRLEQIHVQTWMNPANIVKEIAGIYEPFIAWSVRGKKLNATLKREIISEHMKRVGQFAILYSGANLKWNECLSHYDIQTHDSHLLIELMERKQTLPLSDQTEAITQGLLFVSYLSLLLRRWAMNLMKESELLHMYTPEKIFLELEKIKIIEYTQRKFIHTKLSSKQEEILTAMNLQIEY
jgi:hypothetical protein